VGDTNLLSRYAGLRTLGLAELHEIWKHYDRDGSGYIEAGPELRAFLADMLKASGEEVSELKLEDFTTGVLELFDVDTDGRLDFAELEKLLNDE
jgi:Ca2+-binding EF-hand superfamily protein